jgi:aldose 1-epimerase
MTFQVRIENRPNAFGVDDRVWILDDGAGSFVEVAPGIGFNAYRWHVPEGEILYTDPNFFQVHKPTRTGIPILFPFPNRIRDGRFSWEDKTYQLPTNDSSGKNAIHGFVCQRPWRVVDQGADANSAWVTGEFQGSRDAPEAMSLWPADYQIAVTYRLHPNVLEVTAEVSNEDNKELPYGLGYHPYVSLSPFGGQETEIKLAAQKLWELADNLPTGRKISLDSKRDMRLGRRYAELELDDVFTDLESLPKAVPIGSISSSKRQLQIWVSDIFREIVGFTPPHRQAICLEPYTCVTDAINLQQKGIDAGWHVLKPGMKTTSRFALLYHS